MKKKELEKYSAKKIGEELYEEWIKPKIKEKVKKVLGDKQIPLAMAGPAYDIGYNGEGYVLKQLKNKNRNWEFSQTPNKGQTSADIIGIKQNDSTIYFLLIQVKTGQRGYVRGNHSEKKTLPILKDLLQSILKSKKEKRKVIITTCFVLIETINNKTTIDSENPLTIDEIHHYQMNKGLTKTKERMQEEVLSNTFELE